MSENELPTKRWLIWDKNMGENILGFGEIPEKYTLENSRERYIIKTYIQDD